jgi:threonine dehydrogenase-like Zn-dependent dehydrogenase
MRIAEKLQNWTKFFANYIDKLGEMVYTFKVGDRVVFIKKPNCYGYKLHQTYTVLEKSKFFEQYYTIEFKGSSFRKHEVVPYSVYNSKLYKLLK